MVRLSQLLKVEKSIVEDFLRSSQISSINNMKPGERFWKFFKGHASGRWFLYREFLAGKSESLYTVRVQSYHRLVNTNLIRHTIKHNEEYCNVIIKYGYPYTYWTDYWLFDIVVWNIYQERNKNIIQLCIDCCLIKRFETDLIHVSVQICNIICLIYLWRAIYGNYHAYSLL